ncbi:MAG: hypothetical protein OXD50_08460, partial [Chloroflexi bacterium]|nr:hypothetical protein [Chloroflexota bacterium]
GTKPSGVKPNIIAACRSLSPRIAKLPHLSAPYLLHDLTHSFFSSLLGSYHFSLLGAIQHGNRLLTCSISSEQDLQWLQRQSDPPLDADNEVVVASDSGADLLWAIDPDACRHIVTGRVQSASGEPMTGLTFNRCPRPGGLCPSVTTDRNGEFAFLADVVGDVVFDLMSSRNRQNPCEYRYWLDSRLPVTIDPRAQNHVIWTLPPNTCG